METVQVTPSRRTLANIFSLSWMC